MGDECPKTFKARIASTRPVRVEGDSHETVITREALDGMRDQVRALFVPAHREHLSVFPPIARWYDAEVVEGDDGHAELILLGRPLRHHVLAARGAELRPDLSELPLWIPGENTRGAEIHYEPRAFSSDDRAELRRTAPLPLREDVRWASLPPAEWVLLFLVAWPAVRFAAGFLEEFGRTSAAAVVDWVTAASRRARGPARVNLITLRFRLDADRYIEGTVLLRPEAGEEAKEALEAAGILGSIAALIKERDLLPGFRRACFLWADGDWRLAWWTDGDRVLTTKWFEENAPDASEILGFDSPLLPRWSESLQSDGGA